MYCSLLRLHFTSSTQIKPSQSFTDPFSTHSKYSLLICVVNYPTVANALIMKNCTPASSAAVERLFSASVQVLTMSYTGQNAWHAHILKIHWPFSSIEAWRRHSW